MTSVIIVGAAAMGAATAHHLAAIDPLLEIGVIDRDLSLARSSTMLSDGNVRIQFNLWENIRMSQYAMEVIDTFADDMAVDGVRPDPSPQRQGNLFLVGSDGVEEARAGLDRQAQLGCDIEWIDMAVVADRWPPYFSERLVGGTFGPRDGSVDPSAIVSGYRQVAASKGVGFEEGEVAALAVEDERITGISMADGTVRLADFVVVCAGAWSTELLATAGVAIPVEPVMRTVYVVRSDIGPGVRLPSVFLPNGVYVVTEHDDTYLMGWSRPEDPVGFDFTPANRSRFYDLIWPALIDYLPAFDRLEVVRSWAGLYAQNTLDANAIIGEWPTISALYQATGFSGHGYQQCHAVGRYLAELITGTTPTIDLSRFSPARIVTGEPVFEHAGRII